MTTTRRRLAPKAAAPCPGLLGCPRRSDLLARLYGDFEGRLAAFEAELATLEAEKAVKLIAALASTLDRLIAIDAGLAKADRQAKEGGDEREAGDVATLRAELDALLARRARSG